MQTDAHNQGAHGKGTHGKGGEAFSAALAGHDGDRCYADSKVPTAGHRILDSLQPDFVQYHILVGLVLAIARLAYDLVDHVLAFHDFAEDGVISGRATVWPRP